MSDRVDNRLELSVVIVSYNTKCLTEQCVKSILDQCKTVRLEIIVVDNASQDGSAAHLRNTFPEITVIEAGSNQGFSFANNLGFAASQGEYVLCLNPDTIMNSTAALVPMDHLKAHPGTGMVGVKLVDALGFEQIAAMRFLGPLHFMMLALLPKSLVKLLPFVGDTRYTSHAISDTFPCDSVVGCFMMFPRWLLDEVGGFDDRFFMYGEEVEWCWRIRQAGYEVYYVGASSVMHYDGASTKTMSQWKLVMMARGHILSQALMRGWLAGKWTNVWMIIGQLLRLPFWSAAYAFGDKEPFRNNWAKMTFLCRALVQPFSFLYRDGAV